MKRLLCALLAALFLAGCAGKTAPVSHSVFAMDTLMDMQLWGEDARAAAEAVEDLLSDLENRWSVTREASLVSQLNSGISPEMTDGEKALLQRVEELTRRTGGAFYTYLGAVSELWGFRDKNYRVPTGEEITQALSIRKLDLGAAMKGYAGDQAVALLESMQIQRGILNLGGNVQTFGSKPNGDPWYIAIKNPQGDGTLGTLSVEGTMSIVTSGSYQRYFDRDGKRYHHIMDTKTGCPAESGLVSVTVICKNGLTADALSTALFVMGLERGSRFWQESDDFEAVFVLTDGTVYATRGAKLSGCEYKEITR